MPWGREQVQLAGLLREYQVRTRAERVLVVHRVVSRGAVEIRKVLLVLQGPRNQGVVMSSLSLEVADLVQIHLVIEHVAVDLFEDAPFDY